MKTVHARRAIAMVLMVAVVFTGLLPAFADAGASRPSLSVISLSGEDFVRLEWEMEDSSQPYTYQIYKVGDDGDEFQTISASSEVRVLNVHPNMGTPITFTTWKGETLTLPQSAQTKMWMEKPNPESSKGYGKGLIDVDAVTLDAFNANPSQYMKNPDGTWKYDVVYVGAWDCNGYCTPQGDFSAASRNMVEQFIQAGRGVLMGHDTIYHGSHTNMNSLRSYFNIKLSNITQPGMDYQIPTNGTRSTKIDVTKKGLLTNYPWNIGDVGTRLTVPDTHTSSQVAYGDVWMMFDFGTHPIQGGEANFYLTTWNNTAMIQLGHSNGQATTDEQKVLANTLFYLSQLTTETHLIDYSGQDVMAPEQPVITDVSVDGEQGKINISFNPVQDRGSIYGYYVEALGGNDEIRRTSDTVYATVTSGLRGYSIVIDQNPNTMPSTTITTTGTSISLESPYNNNFFVHVGAVDNVGNMAVSRYYYSNDSASELTITPSTTEWTAGSLTLTVHAEDESVGVRRIQLPSGTWVNGDTAQYSVSANGTYTFTAENHVGNLTIRTFTVTNIDDIRPSAPSIEVSGNEVTIIPGIDNELGVKETRYQVNGGTWELYSAPFVLLDGVHSISARTIDWNNNQNTTSLSNVIIDTVPPSISVDNPVTNFTNEDIVVSVLASDNRSLKGIEMPDGTFVHGAEASYTIVENGSYTFIARDNAGNETMKTIQIDNIDKAPPTAPVLNMEGNVLSITHGEDHGSGVDRTEYRLNGGAWLVYSGSLVLEDGEYVVEAKTIDNAGNHSDVNILTVTAYDKALVDAENAVTEAEILRTQASVNHANQLVAVLPISLEKTSLIDRMELLMTLMQVEQEILELVNQLETTLSAETVQAVMEKLVEVSDESLKNTLHQKTVDAVVTKVQETLYYATTPQEIMELEFFFEQSNTLFDSAPSDLMDGIEEAKEFVSGSSKNLLRDAELLVEMAEVLKREPHIQNASDAVSLLRTSASKTALEDRLVALLFAIHNPSAHDARTIERFIEMAEITKRQPHISRAYDMVMPMEPSEIKTAFLLRLEELGGHLSPEELEIFMATQLVELAERTHYSFVARVALQRVTTLSDEAVQVALMERLVVYLPE